MFLKKSVPLTNLTAMTDEQGRLAFCDFTLGRMEWRVVCLYAPIRGNERLDSFREVQRVLNCERALVVMGNFNCVTRELDRARSSTKCDHSARALLEMTEEFNLFDMGVLHSFSKQMKYTHFQGTPPARLDRVYVSSELLDGLTEYRVKPMYFSDNCLVTIHFGNKPRTTSKFDWKRWKLIELVLRSKDFEEVKMLQERWSLSENISYFGEWKSFKEQVKLSAIEISTKIAFAERAEEAKLQRNLRILIEAECDCPGQRTKDIAYSKSKIGEIHRNRYRGAIV